MKKALTLMLLLGTWMTAQAQSSSLQRHDPIKRGSISPSAAEPVGPQAATIMGTPPEIKKTMEEDSTAGRLKLRYEYLLNGEEHIYERTINTPGKTKKEIQKLIDETERELGIMTV